MAPDDQQDPDPAQKFMYHAGGTLSRFLARFSGEDPDEAEDTWQEGMAELTDGADPVLIGEAISDGIDLGFGLVEKRRALREYHQAEVVRDHGPPAYDTPKAATRKPGSGYEPDSNEVRAEYLEATRDVILEDPGRALVAEGGDTETGLLVAALLEQEPSVPVADAPAIIHDAIKRVGLDALEDRYDELREESDTDHDGDTSGSETSDGTEISGHADGNGVDDDGSGG